MDVFGILAFTFALPALGIAVFTYLRLEEIGERLDGIEPNKSE